MKEISLFFILLWAFSLKSQVTLSQTATQQTPLNNLTPTSTINTWDVSDDQFIGTRYFNDEYLDGELWTTNKTHYTDQMVYRFDEVENAVQIKYKDSNKEVQLFSHNVVSLELFFKGKKITFLHVPEVNTDEPDRLYQVIYYTEKYKVVKLPMKKVVKFNNEEQAIGGDKRANEYREENRYYLKEGNKGYVEFKLSKKGLIKAFPQHASKVERIIKLPKYDSKISDATVFSILQTIESENTTK